MDSVYMGRELACAYHRVRNCPKERSLFLASLSRNQLRIVIDLASLSEEDLRKKMHSDKGRKLAEHGLDCNRGNWSEVLAVLALLSRTCSLNGSSEILLPESVFYGKMELHLNGRSIVNKSTAAAISFRDAEFALADLRQVLLKTKENLDNGSIAVLEALGLVSPDTRNHGKTDIAVLKDGSLLLMSNKSFIGSEPSLLNYSNGADIFYDVPGLTQSDVCDLANAKPQKWGSELRTRNGGVLTEGRFANPVFEQNLRYVSDEFPELYTSMICEHVLSGGKYLLWLIGRSGGDGVLLGDFAMAILGDITPVRQWDGTRHEIALSIVDKAGNVQIYENSKSVRQYLVPRMKFDVPASSRSNNGFSWDAERNCAVLTAGFQIRLCAKPLK